MWMAKGGGGRAGMVESSALAPLLHGHEPDPVAGREVGRRVALRIEENQVGAPDQAPASRCGLRVDARLAAGDSD